MRLLPLVLLAALLAACGAPPAAARFTAQAALPPPPATPAPAAPQRAPGAADTPAVTVLVSLHSSGGFAGFSETLTIYADGRVEAVGPTGAVQAAQVAPADLAALRAVLASPDLAADASYAADGADLIFYELTIPTADGGAHTITTTTAASVPPGVEQLLAALAKLRP